MWIPVAGLPPRLTLSSLVGAGRFCFLGAGAATRKPLQARNRRGLSDSAPQLCPDPDFRKSPSRVKSKSTLDFSRYITSRRLAETMAQLVRGKEKKPSHLFLECNPGPGILTQALLEVGAKVVALESDKTFLPHLESLGKNLDGKLRVIYCDFFRMDPKGTGAIKPPAMASQDLFQTLGLEVVPWKAGIPLKVIGALPIRSERKILWKLIHNLYSCTSIYKYGRIELNVLIYEKEFQELLEPSQEKLYFIQITPYRNLFTDNLTPMSYQVFIHMVKHCFGKRKCRLIDHLRSLTPLDAKDILRQIGKKKEDKVTNLYPQDFKQLFETIQSSKDYAYKWLYDDRLEGRYND
ncbi:dimethyladenosine transferase 2, mitochondrial isoform X2 [Callithrix jacchus]|uniref:dimethyladenosine transferase 2, mitochondrial isoform X2 n=1 Tax=Callithrix jacchus TaxID=9483 RepID=UPI0008401671|nr:dimethyladenosine transferase 2, mitochondrial isoform X2 [Callithrix jacchus]